MIKSPSTSSGFRVALIFLLCLSILTELSGQEDALLIINPTETRQQNEGFGAALAYYEGWLNAHPRRSEIYELIFGGLSLDILRVRNAYGYDPDMIGRVKEYMVAAEKSLGHPIELMSTSWAPVDSLKQSGDRKNGGSLRYTSGEGGVVFDYAGFASWWKASLDDYAAHGIMPDYISIQNEPGWSASYESCLFSPRETINATDTIAGYNKALDAVYDTLAGLPDRPKILGPEVLGIGYNALESYTNALDISKLDGLCHHLYHGVDEDNPYASDVFSKVGAFFPEVPHFQTEYSRGDWFSLAGLIYKSYHDEEVVSYMYWDLIWGDEGGLVTVEFPWDSDRWTDPTKGYVVNREYYAFKQFSAFIHPGWKRINSVLPGEELKVLTFVSPGLDSITSVFINRTGTRTRSVNIGIEGYRISESAIYRTSETEECSPLGSLQDSLLSLAPYSITTLSMKMEVYDPQDDTEAPTVPENLRASDLSHDSFILGWDKSTDNVGVKYYKVIMDGDSLGITSLNEFMLSSLEMGRTYVLAVSAADDAGNESALSQELSVTTLVVDLDPPILECSDSIYQEGSLEVLSSEDGIVYLVPEGCESDISVIRSLAMDSLEVEGGVPGSLPISGLENGAYWLYARDSVKNLSNHADFIVFGWDIDPPVLECSDSIYQEGSLEVLSSEDGIVYLVPSGCESDISVIRSQALDSLEVEGGVPGSLLISGLENGAYWLYARDSVNNLSLPAEFSVYGVGINFSLLEGFSLYPNPMSEAVHLNFTLREADAPWFILYNSQGMVVRKEFLGELHEGAQRFILQRDALIPGIYLFELKGKQASLKSGRLVIND